MRAVVGLVVVMGCTSDPGDGISVTVGGTPALVAARIDDGPWEVQAPLSFQPTSTIYFLPRGQVYDVIAVCKFSDGYLQALETRTTEAERDSDLASGDCGEPALRELDVHVHASEGPLVFGWTGGHDLSVSIDKGFAFEVPAGTIDFVAANADHVAILRGIDASDGITLDPIDLDTVPANQPATLAYDPLGPDVTMFSEVLFSTTNDAFVSWQTTPGAPRLLPELAAGDVETVSLGGYGPAGTGGRSYSVAVGTGLPATAPPWLPPLGSVAFDPAIAVTWTPFASPYTTQELSCLGPMYYLYIRESSGWARSHDEATLAFDHAIVGWDPTWVFPIKSQDCGFSVSVALGPTENMFAYSASFP